MMQNILITGDRGLIGESLKRRLLDIGHYVTGYDIAGDVRCDILDAADLDRAVASCSGIVHLAAVSRVIDGQRNPELCRQVNVQGTKNVLSAATRAAGKPPWVLYASSREVYGQPTALPVRESDPFRPINPYARSKMDAEKLVTSVRQESAVNAAIVRFSGVYGSASDHRDRVVPAFARMAAGGGILSVEGRQTVLDFTYIDDVVTALVRIVNLLSAGEAVPTMHLVSGRGTTLMELASMATQITGKGQIAIAPPRRFDVSAFTGDPELAYRVLGWRAETPLEEGLRQLIALFQEPENHRISSAKRIPDAQRSGR